MVRGIVTPFREATVRLVLSGAAEEALEVEAVIDTGFTDYLTLSPDTIERLGLEFRSFTDVILADGSQVRLSVYRGVVEWDGQVRPIPVIESDGGPLLGMAMLSGCVVTLHVVDGGEVTISAP